jgi:hypothetical protein
VQSGNIHGGVLMVAQREAKEDESDKIAKIPQRFLSLAGSLGGRTNRMESPEDDAQGACQQVDHSSRVTHLTEITRLFPHEPSREAEAGARIGKERQQ